MYYFMTASKDANIYLQKPVQNTGRDEILEISKTYYGDRKNISRSLIQFELDVLQNLIQTGSVELSTATLLLTGTEASEIPRDYTLYAYPVSQSWEMGNGFIYDDLTKSGVTWGYRDIGSPWLDGDYTSGTTGSVGGTGGTWYTGSVSNETFSYEAIDLSMDVTTTINTWLSGSLPNNGFILKYPSEFEDDTYDYGELKFFSKETNTIYQPKLRIGWDTQIFQTGSASEIDYDEIFVFPKRLKSEYKLGDDIRIRIIGRELYPLKTYTNTYGYDDYKILPQTSYYQVTDAVTGEIIIPFSDYSKVSCDENGNYVDLNLTNWETNRPYVLEIKVDRPEYGIEYFSFDDLTFKVMK